MGVSLHGRSEDFVILRNSHQRGADVNAFETFVIFTFGLISGRSEISRLSHNACSIFIHGSSSGLGLNHFDMYCNLLAKK